MSECISREERAFLHTLARRYGNKDLESVTRKIDVATEAARALLASLEAAPPAPTSTPFKVTDNLGNLVDEGRIPAPVEPNRERPGEPLGFKFAGGPAAYVPPKPGRVEERPKCPKCGVVLWAEEYVQRWREERAAHEELRRRVERACEELRKFLPTHHVEQKPYQGRCLCTNCVALGILDGKEKAP